MKRWGRRIGTAKHAEHERTPTMVSSSARHALVDVENTLSTKRHQRWCLVVFGVCHWVQKTRRAREDTIIGVFSCSACVER